MNLISEINRLFNYQVTSNETEQQNYDAAVRIVNDLVKEKLKPLTEIDQSEASVSKKRKIEEVDKGEDENEQERTSKKPKTSDSSEGEKLPKKIIGEQEKIILSYKKRILDLMKEHFPFKSVSRQIVKEAIHVELETRFIPGQIYFPEIPEKYIPRGILNSMLRKKARANELIVNSSKASKELQMLIQELDINDICHLLWVFKRDAKSDNDPLDCFIFCFLLKTALQVSNTLPEKNTCTKEIMGRFTFEVMKEIDYNEYSNPAKLIMLTIYKAFPEEDGLLLNHTKTDFFEFVTKYLLEECTWWTNKDKLIISLLEILPRSILAIISKELQKSACEQTSKIFINVFEGLGSSPVRISHLYMLKELLPSIESYQIQNIFNVPFAPLDAAHSKIQFKDVDSVRRLPFNNSREVIVDEDLIIGRYHFTNMNSNRFTVYLVAYNMHHGHMVWFHPLLTIDEQSIFTQVIHCELTRYGIAIAYSDNSSLYLLGSQTGSTLSTLTLPAEPSINAKLHFTPKGFCYYYPDGFCYQNPMLYGCKIEDGQLKTVFKIPVEHGGIFKPLGEFICFIKTSKASNTCVVYSKTGKKYSIDANLIKFANDQIYTVQHKKLIDGNGKGRDKISSIITSYKLCNEKFSLKKLKEVNVEEEITNFEICEDGA